MKTVIPRYVVMKNSSKNPQTGKYESYFETFHGNITEARKRLRQVLTELDKGIFTKPGKITVADYLRQWLRDYAYMNLAPCTAEGYDSIISRHLIPSFGMIPLTQLRPEVIQRYISDKVSSGRADRKGGLTARTVRLHIVCLHTALQNAIKMGTLFRNPVDAVTIPRAERHEMHTMSETDIHLFLEMAQRSQYYALFYTAIFTGMRRSELLALRWQDVDLLLLQVSINRSLHQVKAVEPL